MWWSKMTNVNDAIKKFYAQNRDRTVKRVYDYKGNYLFIAPDKNIKDVDYSDPYYIFDKKNEIIKSFSPIRDMDGFIKAINGPKLYYND